LRSLPRQVPGSLLCLCRDVRNAVIDEFFLDDRAIDRRIQPALQKPDVPYISEFEYVPADEGDGFVGEDLVRRFDSQDDVLDLDETGVARTGIGFGS